MKKLVLIVIMIMICVFYFFASKNREQFDLSSKSRIEEENIATQLNNMQELLNNNYPKSAKEVIEKNNELMNLFYKEAMQDEYIEQYIEVMRMLYSDELLELNSIEEQRANIELSRLVSTNELIMYGSNIENELKLKENGKVLDDTVIIEVTHYANVGDIKRSYTLVKQDNGWKIESWTDEIA